MGFLPFFSLFSSAHFFLPRGRRSTDQASDVFHNIPAEFKAFLDGWTETTLPHQAFKVVREDEFSDYCHAEVLRDTLLNMANRITSALQSTGQTISEEAIVKYMLGGACSKLYDYATQALTSRALPYLCWEGPVPNYTIMLLQEESMAVEERGS